MHHFYYNGSLNRVRSNLQKSIPIRFVLILDRPHNIGSVNSANEAPTKPGSGFKIGSE